MIEPKAAPRRLRAYTEFLVAVFYFFFARALAHRAALGLVAPQWSDLAEQTFLVLLLLLGYASLGFWLDRELKPISNQGFPRRAGFTREAGTGLALGWALALVCVLPMLVAGGIAVAFQPSAWRWLAADAAFFALLTVAEEIAFRGYGFQRFVRSVGPVGGSIGFALYYALVQAMIPGSSHASFAVAVALGLVLSLAYLRSRALWLSWGLNFGWKASRALLFGLAVSGIGNHSAVVQGDPMGPFWITGGGFGAEGSWITFLVLLIALPVVYRLTRDLDYKYNAPVIVPAGIPVDLDAAARAQHEATTRQAEPAAPVAAPVLVQIGPATPVATVAPTSDPSPDRTL